MEVAQTVVHAVVALYRGGGWDVGGGLGLKTHCNAIFYHIAMFILLMKEILRVSANHIFSNLPLSPSPTE